ncbi:MAG: hypothetical protein QOE06_1999 [Thermoleophilaceae bacterium]|jgi:nucleotide-binding universal stress UspA family protein|nr:hypothetical protein [Thermoleophilaceae bacterium]
MPESGEGLTVVAGYDGSENARAAAAYAVWLAKPDGKVYVVHAYEPPPDWLGYPFYKELTAEHHMRGKQMLDKLSADGLLDGVRCERELLSAQPVDGLMSVATTRDAHMIVVGSRGLGPLRGTLGSVSHGLLYRSDRPVLVLPSPTEPPA